MNFQEYSAISRVKIEKTLLDFLDKKQEATPEVFQQLEIIQTLKRFLLKGKLARGTLFLFACEMFGKEITQELVNVACAIELTHSALLMHDDIIDRDYMRRGGRTVFAQYIERGKKMFVSDPLHYGNSMGIVIGDIAIFFGQELMNSYKEESLADMQSRFAKELYLVGVAEALDSEYGQSPGEPTIEEIYSVYQYKTARYTFSMPFLMAATICDVSKDQRKIIDRIGELVGIIFQIKDDEIGLFGDEEKIGKPVGSDIKENKKTIFRELLFRHATAEDKESLSKLFGNRELTIDDLTSVQLLMEKYHILDLVKKDIDAFMREVHGLFQKLEVEDRYKNILLELLEYNLRRSA